MRLRSGAVMVLGAVVALCAAAPARADSGAITDVVLLADGRLQATYAATSTTCDGNGFCGWYPTATQVEATAACAVATSLTYVGQFQATSGTQTATETTYPLTVAPLRLCLWVNGPAGGRTLVAEVVYTRPPPPPPPPPECDDGVDNDGDGAVDFLEDEGCDTLADDSEAGPAPVRVLRVSEARASVAGVLRQAYGARFARRRAFGASCRRFTSRKVRCRVHWKHRSWRFAGNVTMHLDPDDRETIVYATTIRRTRLKPSAPPPPPPPSERLPSPPARDCDPNYSGCLDPGASDYDCAGGSGNGPRYTGPVRVLGTDHYGLDADGDGLGCED